MLYIAMNVKILTVILYASYCRPEINDCMRKYVDGVTQNLQSLSPY